jgi:hypothetical protein
MPPLLLEGEKIGKKIREKIRVAEENLMRKLIAFAPALLCLMFVLTVLIVANAQETQSASCPEAAAFNPPAEKAAVCRLAGRIAKLETNTVHVETVSLTHTTGNERVELQKANSTLVALVVQFQEKCPDANCRTTR